MSCKLITLYLHLYLILILTSDFVYYVIGEKRQLHLVPNRRGTENARTHNIILNLEDIKDHDDLNQELNLRPNKQGVLVPSIDDIKKNNLLMHLLNGQVEGSLEPDNVLRSLSDNKKLIDSVKKSEAESNNTSNDQIQQRKAKEMELKNEALAKIEELAKQNLEDIARLKVDALKQKGKTKFSKYENETVSALVQESKEILDKVKESAEKPDEKNTRSSASDNNDTIVVETAGSIDDSKHYRPEDTEGMIKESLENKKISSKLLKDFGVSPKPVDFKDTPDIEKKPDESLDTKNQDLLKQLLRENAKDEDKKEVKPDKEDGKGESKLFKDEEKEEKVIKEIAKQDQKEETKGALEEPKSDDKKEEESKEIEGKEDKNIENKKKKIKILIFDDDESIPDHVSNAEVHHVKDARPLIHVSGQGQMNVEEQVANHHPTPVSSHAELDTSSKPCAGVVGYQQHIFGNSPSDHIYDCSHDHQGFFHSQPSEMPDTVGMFKQMSRPSYQFVDRYLPRLRHRHRLPKNPYDSRGMQPPEIHYHFHLSKENLNSYKNKEDDTEIAVPTGKSFTANSNNSEDPQEKEGEQKSELPVSAPYLSMLKRMGDDITNNFRKGLPNIDPTNVQIESDDIPKFLTTSDEGSPGRYLTKRTYGSKQIKKYLKPEKQAKKNKKVSKIHHKKTSIKRKQSKKKLRKIDKAVSS